MQINGLKGLSDDEVSREIDHGAKFVLYTYTISILILTFKRPSDIYFVKGHESRAAKGLKYTAITFLLGWWGIPWGPIYSLGSIFGNTLGGKDITKEVLQDVAKNAQIAANKAHLRQKAAEAPASSGPG